MTGDNPVLACTLFECLKQQHLQFPAVQRVLRPVVTGIFTARDTDYLPAAPGKIFHGAGANSEPVQVVLKAERNQLPRSVGQDINPHTQWFDGFYAFKDCYFNAGLLQTQCGSQTAYSCTCY